MAVNSFGGMPQAPSFANTPAGAAQAGFKGAVSNIFQMPMAQQALSTAIAHTQRAQQYVGAAAAATQQAFKMIQPTVNAMQAKGNLLNSQQGLASQQTSLVRQQTNNAMQLEKINHIKALNEQGILSNEKAAKLISAVTGAFTNPVGAEALTNTGTALGKAGLATAKSITQNLSQSGYQNGSASRSFQGKASQNQNIGNHPGAPTPYHLTQKEVKSLPFIKYSGPNPKYRGQMGYYNAQTNQWYFNS